MTRAMTRMMRKKVLLSNCELKKRERSSWGTTHKNWLALAWRPTIKYNTIEYAMRVAKVIGISTRVMAAASMNGWYMAAF